MTLAVEDSNLNPVDVVAFASVDIKEGGADSLVTADSLATASQVRQQHNDSLGFKLVVACIFFRYILCQEHSTLGSVVPF